MTLPENILATGTSASRSHYEDLRGKVALVTGASSGIGARTAVALARQGTALVLLGRSRDRMRTTAAALSSLGAKFAAVEGDISQAATAATMLDTASAEFGRADILFANAGFTGPLKSLAEYSDDDFDQVVGTNLRGVFLAMRAVLPAMVKAGRGSIVVTASLGSERGLPGSGAYNAAKHGALGLIKTAALEYGRHNIRSNAVLVGLADTPLLRDLITSPDHDDAAAAIEGIAETVPLGRVATPAEIAEAVCFLASDASRYVNGTTLTVDGGLLASAAGMM